MSEDGTAPGMVDVRLPASLRSLAGGRASFPIATPTAAPTVAVLLRRLGETYPELAPVLGRGVAVAIDGQLYRDTWLQPVPAGAEVYLMPRVAGG